MWHLSKMNFRFVFLIKLILSLFSWILFFFCMWIYIIIPESFDEKTFISVLKWLFIFVKNQLTVFVGVYFWTLCSIPLIYVCPVINTTPSWLLRVYGKSSNQSVWVLRSYISFFRKCVGYDSTLAFSCKF